MSEDRAAVEAYVQAIETHLRARRGLDHILSPRDFALARSWHAGGVPLATVLVGMDRAFETGANPRSKANIKGYVRGFDVRSGRRLWIFYTIPRPGDEGRDDHRDHQRAHRHTASQPAYDRAQKRRAAEQGTSVSRLIEQAVRLFVRTPRTPARSLSE